jgi:hypothetical protein
VLQRHDQLVLCLERMLELEDDSRRKGVLPDRQRVWRPVLHVTPKMLQYRH